MATENMLAKVQSGGESTVCATYGNYGTTVGEFFTEEFYYRGRCVLF